MTDSPQSAKQGLIVLQSNRMEDLRDLALRWLGKHPLHPLERSVYLVQSNGIAQWLKTSIAEHQGEPGHGICLGVDVQLPARFQWQAYRSVIEAVEGPEKVPVTSPYDKTRLRWRLMALLPQLTDNPLFSPLARYLQGDDELRKHYQLAERLADLFDQYQVYRADWLNAWEAGDDTLVLPGNRTIAIPDEQRWQPALWRMIIESLGDEHVLSHRGAVHRRFLAAAERLTARPEDLPPRILIFGISSLPQQMLEVLVALSRVSEVVLCLLNPCKHYWGEIIETQEVLRKYHRQQRRKGMPADLHLKPEALHLYAHPLLAAWGKQGRDYLQLLSEHDATDVEATSTLLDLSVDLFQDPSTDTLLGQLQADILELSPLAETQAKWPAVNPDRDTSIRFHNCHSPQRELEVLHDQLLAAFAEDPTLQLRDVLVMVPNINDYAPYIDAVFGQFTPGEARHLPYHVADQQQRHREPMLVALETLLSLPRLRCRASEILDLLDIPPVRERFGLAESDLLTLQRWVHEANVRWGLDAAQRSEMGLPKHDELHTWRFGLERMLMGYAVGEATHDGDEWADIVPYDEVAGLDAALVGPLYRLIMTLDSLRQRLQVAQSAVDWGNTLSALLQDTLAPTSTAEQVLLGRIQTALEEWQQEIEEAGLSKALPLAVVRESWLGRIDEPQLSQSFTMGRVTFATLMPMRAIPFRHVCLLGMNDGAYPRRAEVMDFDLMAMRGHYRAGDRSRRDDDRYLFLEALLSARECLTISWCGRSPKDNSEQPPSVLVGQLRDHLGKGWQLEGQPARSGQSPSDAEKAAQVLLKGLTTEHPLQPFGVGYFQAESPLFTYADEWQGVYDATGKEVGEPGSLPPWLPEGEVTLANLVSLLRDPVSALFQQRLSTHMQSDHADIEDDEPFGFEGLGKWQQREALVQPLGQRLSHTRDLDLETIFNHLVEQRQRAGHYPPTPVGPAICQELLQRLPDTLAAYRQLLAQYPQSLSMTPLVRHSIPIDLEGIEADSLDLVDTLDHLYAFPDQQGESQVARIVLLTSQIHQGDGWHWLQILRHWPAHLGLQLLYPESPSYLVSPSGTLEIRGMQSTQAGERLTHLMTQWLQGMQKITPTHPDLAFAALANYPVAGDSAWPPANMADDRNLRAAWEEAFERFPERYPLFVREFPTLNALLDSSEFTSASRDLYGDLHTWTTL
ncbi:exodeoxyribonuclease V subunit gamma [Halomonas sp. Bachu 37]|uniref:exodeoxyribonuclease V subunit gamma n=1 Tax=Halomonas kashgarensis TaxID=3084920 RepID=UPI003217B61F